MEVLEEVPLLEVVARMQHPRVKREVGVHRVIP